MATSSKMHNIPTWVDNIRFASKKEARHYQELRLRERAGEITHLELQPEYPIVINGKKVCTYRGDFRYDELSSGKSMLIDTKGFRTPMYRLKKKLVEAFYGITIIEV